MDDDSKSKTEGIAIFEHADGTMEAVPAEVEITRIGDTVERSEARASASVGYSRRYSDAWERTFGRREQN